MDSKTLYKWGGVLLVASVVLAVIFVLAAPTILGALNKEAEKKLADRFYSSCKSACGYATDNWTTYYVMGSAQFRMWQCVCRVHPDKNVITWADLGMVKDNLKTFRVTLDMANCTKYGWGCAETEATPWPDLVAPNLEDV